MAISPQTRQVEFMHLVFARELPESLALVSKSADIIQCKSITLADR